MTRPDPPPELRADAPSGLAPVDVRRSGSRPTSEHAAGVVARHSFSFGAHYDPDNLGFGPMVCHDDHRVDAGHGYDDHPHADLEIVTWVLAGALRHRSPSAGGSVGAGTDRVVAAGGAQVLSAGTGLVHAETAEPGAGETRFVQTWLRPDTPGLAPSYAASDGPVTAPGGLVPVAGAGSSSAVGVAGATLWVGTGDAAAAVGAGLALPEAPLLHLYLPRGTARLEDAGDLGPGDAVRLHDSGGRRLELAADAEVLIWSFAG